MFSPRKTERIFSISSKIIWITYICYIYKKENHYREVLYFIGYLLCFMLMEAVVTVVLLVKKSKSYNK